MTNRTIAAWVTALGAVLLSGCAAVAGGLTGFSNGYNGTRQQQQQEAEANAQAAPPTCSSDYSCGYGSTCVKHQFESQGYCAQTTNAYGTPTYAAPNPNSFGPGHPDQCRWDTDCGPGWRCDKGAGLTGTCVR